MTGTILTGAAGSGKTTHIINAILQAEAQAFWREVWVLLPTRLQSEAFRNQLIQQVQQSGSTTIFNVHFFEFYELYDRLLDLAGEPQRTINQAASDRVLRHVIAELQASDQLHYYNLIAHQAGFVQLVSTFIRELKQGLVTLEDFNSYAQNRHDKDRDLALIYDLYQHFLQKHNLIDRDGAGWVALEALRKKPELVQKVALLAVDGFDDFNPLQIQLLTELARNIEHTELTLTYEDHRKNDAARTFARTLQRLTQAGDWEIASHPITDSLPRQSALAHLERELFALHPTSLPADGQLHLIEAPNPNAETQAVLRMVKALLLDGTPPENIAVVVRDVDLYIDALRRTAAAYRLPVVIRQAERLMQNPAVRTVLQLVDLHSLDFPRRQLLDLLHSPYLDVPDFSPEHIALLEYISMEKPIVGGRDNWLTGLASATFADENDDEDAVSQQAHPQAAVLAQEMATFLGRITPPTQATARVYVAWIEDLLGADPEASRFDHADQADTDEDPTPPHQIYNDVGVYRCIRENAEDAVVIRDMYAMRGLWSALRDVMAAYDLLEADLDIAWDTFRADLELAIRDRTLSDEAARSRNGRVLVTSVFEARGLPHPHLFIMGLSEGIFPQRQSEDALYSDRERQFLKSQGIDITTTAERARDTSLFYEMCALAQTRLVLSRPTLDEGGNEWSESVFWKQTRLILEVDQPHRIKLGEASQYHQAASPRELAVSISQLLNKQSTLASLPLAVANWMESQDIWGNVQRGRAIEIARESDAVPFDGFSGILTEEALVAEVAYQLGGNRRWSASQFNDLGQCAFRFFSKRILHLDPYEEPEEGLDNKKLGSVNHKILEETYRRLQNEQVVIAPENTDYASSVLHEVAADVFATAPREFGFQATPVWEQEKANMLRKLQSLVELDFSDKSPISKLVDGERRAYHQEVGFGYDVPFAVEGEAGELRAGGYIDRMDLVDGGVVIVDYKSGSSIPTKADMEDGRNFQMLLYLLAAIKLGYKVRGGLFWSIQRNKSGGEVTVDDEAIQIARHLLHKAVLAARQGYFPNQPRKLDNGRCAHYCEFNQFCRVNRSSQRKTISS